MAKQISDPALGVFDNEQILHLPLKYLTRHSLIAGSTGTGKSRAMQVLAEQLSHIVGVNIFVSDVKGDASGFCVAGKGHERNKLGPLVPHALNVNYWSISNRFIPFRFSLSSVGSVLISRLLSLNPTQESHLSLAFSYARKNNLPLDNLDQLLDLFDVLIQKEERGMSKSSISVIQRKILALEESGIGNLFGKPSIRLNDLNGLNVLNLSDARKDMAVSIAPAFLLQLLFDNLPEVGDVKIPRFVIFFDEAHYLFKDANKSLKDRMVTILKQIRSKGVSVFFVTQDVTDLPDEILSQLSTKIIFSQKVFTQKGNKRLKALANSFPKSEIDVMEKLKRMPPGIALVSTLDKTGNQTEPKEVTLFAPITTMNIVADDALLDSTDPSLIRKYNAKSFSQIPAQQFSKAPPQQHTQVSKQKSNSKKSSSSIWDKIFKFLLKLLDFLLKALGKIFSFILFKPGKKLFKWLIKKPIRIIWFLVFIILLYFVIVNWNVILDFLDFLKLK